MAEQVQKEIVENIDFHRKEVIKKLDLGGKSLFLKEKIVPRVIALILEGQEEQAKKLLSHVIGENPVTQLLPGFVEDIFITVSLYLEDLGKKEIKPEKLEDVKVITQEIAKEEAKILPQVPVEQTEVTKEALTEKIEISSTVTFPQVKEKTPGVLGTPGVEKAEVKVETITGKEAIKLIGDLLEKGVDKIVIHGKKAYSKKDKIEYLRLHPDLDTLGALYLLNEIPRPDKKIGVSYNPGAYTEIVEKGEAVLMEPDKVIIHVDTGARELTVEKAGKAYRVFIDHHSAEAGATTSATALVAKIMEAKGWLKEKPAWLESFIKFMNETDNLSYVNYLDSSGKKLFNETFFRDVWPKSLYGLFKDLPFKFIKKAFETKRDPWRPFTEKELEGEIGSYVISPGITLKALIKSKDEDIEKALSGVKNIRQSMQKRRIETWTKELGGIVFHDYVKVKDPKTGGLMYNTLPPEGMGFLATKASGYDTFVEFNRIKQTFFVNSHGKDLSGVFERLSKVAPGTDNVRNMMLFSPKDKTELKDLTEAKFLEILGL